ncbi:MAG: biotin carboxylase, partial [Saprospiraceae bacterium]
FVMEHPAFRAAQFDTNFIKQYYTPELLRASAQQQAGIAAQVALRLYLEDRKKLRLAPAPASNWPDRV